MPRPRTGPIRTYTNWTPQMLEYLHAEWTAGTTAKAIGDVLGLNKNMIIGKVHALDLPRRPSPLPVVDPNALINTPAGQDAFRAALATGMRRWKIAEQFGFLSVGSVNYYKTKFAIQTAPPTERVRRHLTPDELAQLKDDWLASLHITVIMERLKCSKGVIMGHVQRMGLVDRDAVMKDGTTVHRNNNLNRVSDVIPINPVAIATHDQRIMVPDLLRPQERRLGNAQVRHDLVPVITLPPLPSVHAVPAKAKPIASGGRVTPCCWPMGDPGTPAFRYCDDPSRPGKSYCDAHYSVAYVNRRPMTIDQLVPIRGPQGFGSHRIGTANGGSGESMGGLS